jgi:hypothetical protein
VGGTQDLNLLLPDCPEISSTINYNQELASLEKGVRSVKADILSTHNKLEEDFNNYDENDDEDASSVSEEDGKFDTDITKLLNSNFFNKNKNQEEEVDVDIGDAETGLEAKLDGFNINVESAAAPVGVELTESDADSPTTESATSES